MVAANIDAAKRMVTTLLQSAADPSKTPGMQAYMKTEMPFYGVQKAGRTPILRQLVKEFITPERLPLYRQLIVDGGWWDFVDEVATQLVRSLVINHPKDSWPTVDTWIHDEDMWLRRAAIICQVGAKDHTDPARLFRFCEVCIDEREFFIRKAIGWALREYAKTEPDAVADFINGRRDGLSGLSFREGSKHIKHLIRE